ncbi:MAG: T9SS type A sorting domain-containing protein [Bacteroidetes bacterium]|nr:T9SS type A sorting domain-containing protein [Bacteroidota bacterium]
MNIKNHTAIFILLIVSSLPFGESRWLSGWGGALYAQFIGGSGGGLAYSIFTQGVCVPGNNNIYLGGTADGFSYNTFTQGVCVPGNNNIYLGGTADGFSYNTFAQGVCVPGNNNIYLGGDADGFSYINIIQGVCVPGNNNIYMGGIADGFSYSNIEQTNCSLPIELLFFTAVLTADKQVLCQWETASESNNDYFTIEKTKDDSQYAFVGKIKGGGNSNVTLAYQLIDADPYKGTSYYRLKQTDFNGAYTYSQLVPVNLNGVEIISIFPNPAHDKFEYEIGSTEKMTLQVKVVNLLGQITINETKSIDKGISNHTLNVSTLSSGSYLLQITNGNLEKTQKQFVIR